MAQYKRGEGILTRKQIEWAYDKWCLGYTHFEIGFALGVCSKTIQRALRGKPKVKPILVYKDN